MSATFIFGALPKKEKKETDIISVYYNSASMTVYVHKDITLLIRIWWSYILVM